MTTRTRRATFHWPPREPEGGPRRAAALSELLSDAAGDRVATAAELVREAAAELGAWLRRKPIDWGFVQAAAELEEGWADWLAAHGWRGPTALWIDALRGAFHRARAEGRTSPRDALLEEDARWSADDSDDADDTGAEAAPEAWGGEPLVPGRRLPRRRDVVPAALRELSRGEVVLVHGYSETVAGVLAAACEAGLDPLALLTEGGPEAGGKRLARRLAEKGVRVRLGVELAWVRSLAEVDRVWLGTEAIGAGAFVGRVGAELLLGEARRRGVPSAVLTTSDKLVPGGRVELPRWAGEEDWILWSDPPPGVELARELYELVPLELVDGWLTEAGREGARALFLRALRPEPAPPLR